MIEDNVWDGVAIGNTPDPYTVSNNRISRNGRYGYRQHNPAGGPQELAANMVVIGNGFWDDGLDGIFVDSALKDPHIAGNRIRANGRQCEPATEGGGDTVFYTPRSMIDTAASWRPNGHIGKWVAAAGNRPSSWPTTTPSSVPPR